MNIYRKSAGVPSIPIVPMLDILTILLIFFIVHTEFKHQVSVLDISLPHTQHLATEKGDNTQVLLEVASDGTLALSGKRISRNELSSALHELLEQAPQSRLQVAAADEASLGALLQVLDTLSDAGLQIELIPLRVNTDTKQSNTHPHPSQEKSTPDGS